MDVRWLEDDEQALWRAWMHTQAWLHACIQQDLREGSRGDAAQLSEPEFEVLVQLTDEPGGLRIGELARRLHWDRSRLSHLVTRMHTRGLVERADCPTDRRGAVVAVSPAGRAAIEAATPGHVETVRREFFDRLSPDDLTRLRAILARLQPDDDPHHA